MVERATGEYEREVAQKKANQMEAEARFWEDIEIFRVYAQLGYSPRYCHDSFIAAKHVRFDRFKSMLKESGVTFAKPSQWRDLKKKASARGKKYEYKGKRLTAPQILESTRCAVSLAALRYRLDKGWDVEKAVNTPLISPQESGRQGANIVNSRKK